MFAIDATPLPDESALCASVGATYTADGLGWDCELTLTQEQLYSDFEYTYVNAMEDACGNDGATISTAGQSDPDDPDLLTIAITCQP